MSNILMQALAATISPSDWHGVGYAFVTGKAEKSKNGGTQSGAANLKRAAKRRNNIRKHKG